MLKLQLLAAFVIFLSGAAAHSHHRRDLQQAAVAPAQGASRQTNRDRKDGKIFDFTAYGGASSFLASLEQNKLRRVFENSGWQEGKNKLAKQLDEDPDFVSQ
jgi:hypothetical protein